MNHAFRKIGPYVASAGRARFEAVVAAFTRFDADAVDQFHREHLDPYVNFHRPCAVPKTLTAANGKRRRVYLRWATPFELFHELPSCEKYLRPHVKLAELDRFARIQSDTEGALAMQSAKRKLFQSFQPKRTA